MVTSLSDTSNRPFALKDTAIAKNLGIKAFFVFVYCLGCCVMSFRFPSIGHGEGAGEGAGVEVEVEVVAGAGGLWVIWVTVQPVDVGDATQATNSCTAALALLRRTVGVEPESWLLMKS